MHEKERCLSKILSGKSLKRTDLFVVFEYTKAYYIIFKIQEGKNSV